VFAFSRRTRNGCGVGGREKGDFGVLPAARVGATTRLVPRLKAPTTQLRSFGALVAFLGSLGLIARIDHTKRVARGKAGAPAGIAT
jgi:hypothetical protein